MGNRLFLFLLACALCMPSFAQYPEDYAECSMPSQETTAEQGDTLAQCTSAFMAVVAKAMQLEDRLRHYDFQQETVVLLNSWWSSLQLGAVICLLLMLADNARLRRQLNRAAARFSAQEKEKQAAINGIKLQAADLGERAVQHRQDKDKMIEQYSTLVKRYNALLLVLRNTVSALSHTKEDLKKAQGACAAAKVNHHGQTVDLDALAPSSPLAAEALSPYHHPQLEAEASTPELSDLIAAAANHDTTKRKSDRVSATALKITPGTWSPDSKLQNVQADVDTFNQHLEEQGAPYRVMLTPSAISTAAAAVTAGSSPAAATTITAAAPAAICSAVRGSMTAAPDMLPLPSPDAAVFHGSSSQQGQVAAVQQQSILHSSSQGSKFVTHDELKLLMLETECQKLKEENKLLKEEVKVQHVPFQSPGITPLAASYVNTRRGAATPPMPLHFTGGGMPGSAGSFVSMAAGNPYTLRLSSTDVDSSAAASSSCFKLPVQHIPQQIPGSAGSTKQSPPGQAAAAGMVLTPGSSATSCSGMGRTNQHTTPVPMQPLGDAASPSRSPVRPQLTRSPAKESTAKRLSDAIDVFAKKPNRIRELADKSSKAVESQPAQKQTC